MTFSFDMTEDPGQFEEAVEAFANRRVVTRKEADTLEEYARQRVWWISGVAQMDVVNDAHASLLKAMSEGVSFEDWKKDFGPKLEAAWGRKDGHRLLTIYRNATHFAYAAGRERQMRDPAVMALRPYHEFVAVEDLAECEICADCDGVILPADHPWWETHSPLLHHCCRCQKRSLRGKTALATGITKVPPEVTADDGFGLRPDASMPPKPVDRTTPPDPVIHRELYLKQQTDAKKRKPRKIKLKKEHDPEHWEAHYRDKYGDVAKQVGYGRAVHERAKTMSAKEALEIIDELPAARSGIGILPWQVKRLRAETSLSKPWSDMNTEARILATHARLVGGRAVPSMEYLGGQELNRARVAVEDFYGSFVSPSVHLPEGTYWGILPEYEVQRSHWNPAFNEVALAHGYERDVAVHEYGHAVEALGKLGPKAKAFIETRTRGESLVRLDALFPGSGYRPDEVTRPDKFYKAYIGKEYNGLRLADGSSVDSTELISQVLGDIAKGETSEILRRDPETLYFVLGLLAGL